MKILLYLGVAALLLPPVAAFAADVDYQHPTITIVANNEPLDSVLKSVSREMKIFVTTPSGFNPTVNCDIQNQPVEKAFKTLMGSMSYSLEWKNDGQQLIGLTILSGSDEPGAARDGIDSAADTAVNQVPGMPGVTHGVSGAGQQVEPAGDAVALERPDRDEGMNAEVEARELVARKLEEREIELELRRQEAEIAREARMEEDKVRNQAEMAEYFETFGISPTP